MMDDDAILTQAAEILAIRRVNQQQAKDAETKRLFKRYASQRDKEPHDLGGPKKLLPEEALLLVALERNKYIVSIEKGQSRWNGDAECKFHLRGTAIGLSADSRLDLLWELWAIASDQIKPHGEWGAMANSVVLLEEEHLRGSIVERDIRSINQEVKEQEQVDLRCASSRS